MSSRSLSPAVKRTILILGVLIYTSLVLIQYLRVLISWPGYKDLEKYKDWLGGKYDEMNRQSIYIWLSMNFLSTGVTCFAMIVIFRTIQNLGNIDVNRRTLFLHCFVLVTLCAILAPSFIFN